jgi:hypothetical protein
MELIDCMTVNRPAINLRVHCQPDPPYYCKGEWHKDKAVIATVCFTTHKNAYFDPVILEVSLVIRGFAIRGFISV